MGLTSTGGATAAPPAGGGAGDYIVVLHPSVDSAGAVARDHGRAHGAQARFVYEHALKGYAATLSEAGLRGVQRDRRVAYVERDGVATINHHVCGHNNPTPGNCDPVEDPVDPVEPTPTCSSQTLPWGIDRVEADLSSTIAGDCAGAVSNVNVYVIDTGVSVDHTDLSVVGHVNFAGGPNKDCNGHGTHVAGTMAAKDNNQDVVGVAPGAPVTGVKVLGCSGSGSWSGVIAGVDWVTANARKPAVANMSLSGGAVDSLDDAVRRSAASGVVYSLAAGNDGTDACTSSPARAGAGTDNGIITVAATDSSDREASWSNYGSCVDLWAPGVGVLSTSNGGGTTTMSGTSMAAPHVGGGAALYLSALANATATPAAVEAAINAAATSTGTTSKNGAPITLLNVDTF